MALFNPIQLFGIDFEFFLFAFTLIGVAVLHHHTLKVALTGLATVLLYKLLFTSFNIPMHLVHEWKDLLNLFGLLIGFTILADYFEHSGVPAILPRYLPDDWKGPFALLVIVFILSAFLDSIAAVMIGGGIAHTIFKRKVHIGYIVGIVAASNAGGSGSVLGNITTTMMWVQGVAATDVLHAYAAAAPALLFGGFFASRMQHNYQPILKDEIAKVKISRRRLAISAAIILGAIATNILFDFPVLGVWIVILVSSMFVVKASWREAKSAVPGSVFLLALVLAASMMPVEQLPDASWQTALVLGLVSSIFDNIPLTKLALTQGGYDWGVLAYSVGYGGSLIWFGSSAGVAITNLYPKARSVADWVKNGWYVLPAYLIGFAVIMLTLGWHPHAPHKDKAETETTQQH